MPFSVPSDRKRSAVETSTPIMPLLEEWPIGLSKVSLRSEEVPAAPTVPPVPAIGKPKMRLSQRGIPPKG